MRNFSALLMILFLSSFSAAHAGPYSHVIGAFGGSGRVVEAAGSLVDVKYKCGIDADGSFGCKNVQKTDENEKSSGATKCRGKNDCPAGYRDLDFPNKHGACCERTSSPSKTQEPEEPKTGGCRSIEKMSEMSCKPPFDAMSCGPQQNGKMTCCCVK